jgi:hypothetical protein
MKAHVMFARSRLSNTKVNLKFTVFWDVTACNVIENY